jgi:hypothetical protein
MLKKIITAATLGLSLFACTGDNPPTYAKNGVFIEPHNYTEADPKQDCKGFNCVAQLSFSPDGEGTLIYSDIANRVTYKIKNDRLTTSLVGAGDIPKKLEFDIIDNANSLVQRDTGTVFNLKRPTFTVFKATGARQCEPGSGISLEASKAKFAEIGVTLYGSSCGVLTGVAYPAVCGGGTPNVNIHTISDLDIRYSLGIGYIRVENSSTPIEKAPCP